MEKGFKKRNLKHRPIIIAITGAESTGKSTLSEALANYYRVPFHGEYARDYILNLGRKYTFEDVEFIARKQLEQYNELVKSDKPLVILDTWLVITKIWFDVVFDRIPEWIEEAIRIHPVDMFLVCDIDLPWKADDVRENGGENRLQLQQRYIKTIENYNFPYRIVGGNGNARLQNAIKVIDRLHK